MPAASRQAPYLAVTIHAEHPFLDPEPDPVRRLRGRLGGAVTPVDGGGRRTDRAGLTVTR